MYDLRRHPYFSTWKDPQSGLESSILTKRVSPIQQSFYFTNPSISADGAWLWFWAAYPPNLQKTLGVVSLDPDKPSIQVFPQAGFTDATPLIAPDSSGAYFCMEHTVYKVTTRGEVSEICSVDKEYIGMRHFRSIATHLTLSADGKYLLLDGDLGNFWWVGIGDIESGEVTILKEFANKHNHAQFSPTDPTLFMIPEDWWFDKLSGRSFQYDHRIWLMNIQQTRYENIRPKEWDGGRTARASHEWWAKDGTICWNDYDLGAHEYIMESGEIRNVWKRPLCHAHCNKNRTLWCADQNPYHWKEQPVEVLFYNRKTEQESRIVSAMPQPPFDRGKWHIDPHPQFSLDDSRIIYTTTVLGKVDVAIIDVAQLSG